MTYRRRFLLQLAILVTVSAISHSLIFAAGYLRGYLDGSERVLNQLDSALEDLKGKK